jgi:hypothetical protein
VPSGIVELQHDALLGAGTDQRRRAGTSCVASSAGIADHRLCRFSWLNGLHCSVDPDQPVGSRRYVRPMGNADPGDPHPGEVLVDSTLVLNIEVGRALIENNTRG